MHTRTRLMSHVLIAAGVGVCRGGRGGGKGGAFTFQDYAPKRIDPKNETPRPLDPSTRKPETNTPKPKQGIFTNFKRLLDFNGGRLPMAVAQTGKANLFSF